MAVCENYKCIQRKRECKKLLQGWSKQMLNFVGMETILESFVGEEVASYLLQSSRSNSPRDFDSKERFCFYNNTHEPVLESCGGSKLSGSMSAVSSEPSVQPAGVGRSGLENGLASTNLSDGGGSRLLLNFGNLGSAGGPVCFTLDSASAESEGLEDEASVMSHLRSVVDATTLFSALQQQHSQQQAVAAMAAASQYLSQRNSTISQLLSSDPQSIGLTADIDEMKATFPQDEPLDLTVRVSSQSSVKLEANSAQDIKSRTSNSNNATNALHAFSLLSAKTSSNAISTSSTKQLLQQLNTEASNSSHDSLKSENTTHNNSHRSVSHNDQPFHQGSAGGAPVRKTYTEAELTKAVRAILHGKLGTRRASAEFGIPRSTLRNKICKLNEMKRKEEESTGQRIEMEDFLESVIHTPIFQVNCRRDIAPAKLMTHSKLPNSCLSNDVGSPSPPKKPCLSNGATLSAASICSAADKQVPSPTNSTPSCASIGGGVHVKPSTSVAFPATDIKPSSSPCTPPPNAPISENPLNNAFACAIQQRHQKDESKQHQRQWQQHQQERTEKLQRELHEQLEQQLEVAYPQQWSSSNIVTSMVEVAKRCLAMSEEEKTTYLDQQYRKYGDAYTSNFVQYMPWFMMSLFSNPAVLENFVGSPNFAGGMLDSSSAAALTAAVAAAASAVPSSSSYSLLDGFLNQCAASAITLDHSGASPVAALSECQASSDATLERPVGQENATLPPPITESRVTNHSSSSTTEPALSVAMETGSGDVGDGGSCCESWSSSPSPEVEAYGDMDIDRVDLANGVDPTGRAAAIVDSENDEAAKAFRSKRGNYRRYNSEALLHAVKAVSEGLMTVHKAGTHFGVPHSTLEYKVKERFLRQEHHADDDEDDGLSSPAESTSGATQPPLGAGGVIFPGMDKGEEEGEEEEDGYETDGKGVPVPVAMETVDEEDGGGNADDTATREVSLADRSSSLSPPLSDSC